jgi:hypothetical protein
MATVRFSQELRDKIKVNAGNLFTTDLQKADAVPDGLGDKIYEIAYGSYIPAMNALPTGFLYTLSSISVKKIGDVVYSTPRLSFRNGKRPIAETPLANMLYKSNYSREDWDLIGDGWAEVKQELDLRKNRIAEVARKKNEFVESVNKIINSYETLAPALKAWQPLWDLVPEEYKERHRKVVERTKNEVVLDVNLDTLTAQVIKSKLTR